MPWMRAVLALTGWVAAGAALIPALWLRRLALQQTELAPDAPSSKSIAGTDGAGGLYAALLASIFLFSLTSPAFSKLEAYFAAFVLTDPFASSIFLVSVALGKVLVQPLWVRLADATSLKATLGWAAMAWAGASMLFLTIAPFGDYAALLCGFSYGAAWGGVAMALWSLLAQVAATDPTRAPQRYGLFTFTSKLAQSAAIYAIGNALAGFDYRQSPDSIGDIHVLMGLPPALGAAALACIGVLLITKLTTARPAA